jgi:glucokinase
MSILAIDFGGTRTRAAWFSDELQLLARHETFSRVEQSKDEVITRIIETAHQVVPDGAAPDRIGIAAPGPLNPQRGIIHYAKTLPDDWHAVPLAHLVSAAFDSVPTHMQNDGNLAALAEYHLGAARGVDPAIYMTISTGIGGGAVVGGKLFAGASGLAIEPGHMQFTAMDGNVYRLEELASGTAIGRIAGERLRTSEQPSALRAVAVVDGQAVGEAAQQGDPFALQIVNEAGRWFGLGCVNLLHLFNPRVIVVGGSVTKLGALYFAPAKEIVAARILHPDFWHDNLIQPAQLGEDVCLFGAALYAREQS